MNLRDTEDNPEAHRYPQAWFLLYRGKCSLHESKHHVKADSEAEAPVKFEILSILIELDPRAKPCILTTTFALGQALVSPLYIDKVFSIRFVENVKREVDLVLSAIR